MPYSINGATIQRLTLTRSWGQSPASAQIDAVGASLLQPESSVTLNIGSFVFYGEVGNCVENTGTEGKFLSITCPDNRIKLTKDTVFGVFNDVVILEDDPATPGIDRVKRYRHTYPVDWDAQKRTTTREPHTAAEILRMLFDADTVHHGWGFQAHARLNQSPGKIDANRGEKLGNVVQRIAEACGLMMTLQSGSLLGFAVKGEGAVPVPSFNAGDRSEGVALGPDTRVRIVGERSVYQDLPITLEPDWNAHYQDFVFEPLWIAEVKAQFALTTDAEAAARAREVTLRQYCEKKGHPENRENPYADFGTWGEVSRMEIPVWTYINDIVFKAYRVPRSYTINGIDLASLALRDGLLAPVTSNEDGAMTYQNDGYYPDAKAFVIAKGQPLDSLDPKFLESISADYLTAARARWSPVNKFNLDTKNNAVIFEQPVFTDAAGAGALYVEVNAAVADATDDLKKLVVPNANAAISAAEVRASLCFEAEYYSKWFGSGHRDGTAYVQNLNYHALMTDHFWTRELKYANDKGADQIAAIAGDAALTGQNFLKSGGFTRYGVAGMPLTGAIDRVTVTMQFTGGGEGDGISERIDYAKERAPIHFEAEREIERRTKVPDAIKNIRALHEQAEQIRFIGRHQKPVKRNVAAPLRNLNHALSTPIGAADCGLQTFSSETTWLAGMPVFVLPTGVPDPAGKIFRGVVIAHQSTGPQIPVATQGTVPVRVTGPFTAGDSIGIDEGADTIAKVGGTRPLGQANATYAGTEVVTVPVRLGAGGGGAETHPFQGYQGSAPLKLKLKFGKANHLTPANMTAEFTMPASSTTFAWLKATINAATHRITALEIESGAAVPETPTGDVELGTAPEVTYRGLVRVTTDATRITAIDALVKDSQWVTIVPSMISPETGLIAYDVIWTSATDGTPLFEPV